MAKKNIEYGDVKMMSGGKDIGSTAYDATKNKMPVAKNLGEFSGMLVDLLAANKAEFALYVSSIGVLPSEENSPFALFSDDTIDGEPVDPDGTAQFTRLAAMFYSLCENLHLNTKEELERFVKAVAMAAMRCGDKSFNE